MLGSANADLQRSRLGRRLHCRTFSRTTQLSLLAKEVRESVAIRRQSSPPRRFSLVAWGGEFSSLPSVVKPLVEDWRKTPILAPASRRQPVEWLW